MGITVRRSISVRAIVTEALKQELRDELQQVAEEAQRRVDQMETQGRRLLAGLQRTDLTQAMDARRQTEAARQRHDALRQDIQRQIQEAEKLELGSEYPRGTIEGSIEVQEGDDLLKKLATSEIVIKDGVIVEIREA
jgi:benzoyl-CoA reductase/2-hydroxyglutaryl-CoA dehydratase subunit BcrC/BadD/HgdB